MIVAALVIRLGPLLSVSDNAPAIRLLVLISTLKVTLILETAVFRGLGETGAIESMVRESEITSVMVPLALL